VTTPDIHILLTRLASRRPVFHSEADFQHAFAWELQLADRNAHIRLEKQVASDGARAHLDLLVQTGTEELAIELKYKTRAANLVYGDEIYSLRNQSAQDIGRHDFIKDIHRLEKYVQDHRSSTGYAILLTNDRTYWTESRKADSVDSQFRVHEGRMLEGGATWGANASAGTRRKREEPIAIRGKYQLQWFNYSSFGAGIAEVFRCVVLRVHGSA
jgi:hypothetical protein